MEVLSALTLTGMSHRPSDLATGLSIERSTMSRNLSLMEAHGLIEATATSPTGRSTRFGITEHGRKTLASAPDAWRQAQSSLISKLGDGAATTLDAWIAELNAPDTAIGE
jgi:DNA-binding MarR family transcriptional regulator